jgi:hypothetical protein
MNSPTSRNLDTLSGPGSTTRSCRQPRTLSNIHQPNSANGSSRSGKHIRASQRKSPDYLGRLAAWATIAALGVAVLAIPQVNDLISNLLHKAYHGFSNGRLATFAVSGSLENGYTYSPSSTVTVDTTTGLVVSAHIEIQNTGEIFTGKPAWQVDSNWEWINQGLFKGSLQLQNPASFKNFNGGFLPHAAYWTTGWKQNTNSTTTYLRRVQNERDEHAELQGQEQALAD